MINKTVGDIQLAIKKLKWFNNYHTFEEIGVFGLRDNVERAEVISAYDFTDEIVLDYGCNLGKTVVLAKNLGAKEAYGVDVMADTISLANNIADVLKIQAGFGVVDLNAKAFSLAVESVTGHMQVDISLFLSIYGTKEFHNRDTVLRHILTNSRKYVFFEGHDRESWNKYSRILLRDYNIPFSFTFKGYLRDSSSTMDCAVRPFFVIDKLPQNWDTITDHITQTIEQQHTLSIGFEGLAGSGNSYYSKNLLAHIQKTFPNKSVLIVDDLVSNDGYRYLPFGTYYHKLKFMIHKHFLRQKVTTLHAAYKLYDIVIVADYRIRAYVSSLDVLVSLTANSEEERRSQLKQRGNASHRSKYGVKNIFVKHFACKHFFRMYNTYGK